MDELHPEYLSATEALQMLNLRKQTLYAYVSRGWIRSVLQPGKRERLYLREDVERVKARSRTADRSGAMALRDRPEPSISTSITEITPLGPRYRGHSAVQLARSGAPFESVAELLWTGIWHDEVISWPVVQNPRGVYRPKGSLTDLRSTDQVLELFASITLQLGIASGSTVEVLPGQQTMEAARQIIQILAGYLGYTSSKGAFANFKEGEGVASGLVRSLGLTLSAENREAIRTILIVFADHALSPDAFAARATASSGATLHSGIASALCSSTGTRVGGLYDQLERFLHGAKKAAALSEQAQRLTDCGMRIPGFGNPLYPRGDPRCQLLLEVAQKREHQTKQLEIIFRFIEDVEKQFGLFPRHEFGLVTLGLSLGVPRHTSGALFAISRMVGWVAHIQEQRLSGMLVPPRAKYLS